MVGALKIQHVLCFLALVSLGCSQICENSGLTNGCSVPLNLHLPFQRTFTPSCHRHDLCYACGQRYGISRRTCDSRFRTNMLRSCNSVASFRRVQCRTKASVFYGSVRAFGRSRYRRMSPAWCSRPWIISCIR